LQITDNKHESGPVHQPDYELITIQFFLNLS